MCVCVCADVYTDVETEGHQESSSKTLYLIVGDRVSQRTWNMPILQPRLASEPQGRPVSVAQHWDCSHVLPCQAFYMDAGDTVSGLRVYAISPLTAEPSPQPPDIFPSYHTQHGKFQKCS